MPRVAPKGFKRDQLAKTGVRLVEARMIREIADEDGIIPSEVVYIAVMKLLRERRPQECEVNRVGVPFLPIG